MTSGFELKISRSPLYTGLNLTSGDTSDASITEDVRQSTLAIEALQTSFQEIKELHDALCVASSSLCKQDSGFGDTVWESACRLQTPTL